MKFFPANLDLTRTADNEEHPLLIGGSSWLISKS